MLHADRYFVVPSKSKPGKAEAITLSGNQEPEGAVIKVCDSRQEADLVATQENDMGFREQRIANAGRIRRVPAVKLL